MKGAGVELIAGEMCVCVCVCVCFQKIHCKAQNEVEKDTKKMRQRCGNYFVGIKKGGKKRKVLKISHQKTDV